MLKRFFPLLPALVMLMSHSAFAERDSFYLGNGHNGALTVNATGVVVNTYVQVTAPVVVGDAAVTVADSTGFAVGDLVMLYQTTGIVPEPPSGGPSPVDLSNSPVGRWELGRLTGLTATSLTFRAPMLYSFAANATQAIRVPEYTTVTINAARSITAPAWNGSTGGVVAFLATGTLTNNGSIDVRGRGFRGGLSVDDSSGALGATGLDEAAPVGGQKGEGIAVTRYGTSVTGRGRVANGAGGGVALHAGGGGGANGGSGGQGGNSDLSADGNRAVGGQGGAGLTFSVLDHMIFGGGGGAGHSASGGVAGGAGGGSIFVRVNQLAGAGSIFANGSSSSSSTNAASGGGGGGTVVLRIAGAASMGVLQATGGTGGSSGSIAIGPGGGGGGGRVLFQKGSGTAALTGTAVIAANPGTQLDPGAPGGAAYGASAGSNGSTTVLIGGYAAPTVPVMVTPANGATITSLRPAITGTTSASITVHILIDDVEVTSVSSDVSGNFTYTPTADLSVSSHTVKAYAENTTQASFSAVGTANSFSIVASNPEIALSGNGVTIADGDTTPQAADYTSFGSVLVTGATVSRSFTIANTGSGPLNLTGTVADYVTLSGDTGHFSVTAQPTTPVGATDGTTTFTITFDPASIGVKTATVSILNDDADESPYTFSISGTGIVPQPGNLDITLDADGRVTTNRVAGSDEEAYAVAVQSDGKIVVGGYGLGLASVTNDFMLVRYNADGSLDTSWDMDGAGGVAGGIVTTDLDGGADVLRALKVLPAGKILVAGYAARSGGDQFALVQYNANGTLDTDFGTGGKVFANFSGPNDQASALAVQADGKILLAGRTGSGTSYSGAIARYSSEGVPDASFGTDGLVTAIHPFGGEYTGIAIQPVTGRILVAGFASNALNNDIMVEAYDATGTLDMLFGMSGTAMLDLGGYHDEGRGIAVRPDGRILVVGTFNDGLQTDVVVAGFTDVGDYDYSFGYSMAAVTTLDMSGGLDDQGLGIALRSDGSIAVIGQAGTGEDADFGVAVLTTDGAPDTRVSGTGMEYVNFFSDEDTGRAITWDAQGYLVAVGGAEMGATGRDFAVARLVGPELAAGDIAISGNSVGIVSGDTTPALADHTDFGDVAAASGSLERTFTLTNTGASSLTLTGTPYVAISGAQSADFTVTEVPAQTIAALADTTFKISFDPAAKGLRSATVTVASNAGNEPGYTFAIQGTGINSAPTDITLTPASIAENNAPGATIGTLAAVDADVGDTHAFTLVRGSGDTDNGSFTIDGTTLKITPAANFETKPSYSIRINVNDGTADYAEALVVTVTNVNEAPAFKDAFASHLLYETVNPTRVSNNIVYAVNNAESLADTEFNRVRYRMELNVSGTLRYADVAFDAWDGLTLAGLKFPDQSSPTVIKDTVLNMTVESNYPGVVNGTEQTGHLEIWPSNYGTGTTMDIGGSPSQFDFDDNGYNTALGYGSFQVHNLSAGPPQTVLAWNNHSAVNPDIGFGNRSSGEPDWTFDGGSLGKAAWKLQVYIEDTIAIPAFQVAPNVPSSLQFPANLFIDDSASLTVTLSISDGVITGNTGTGVTIGGTALARTFTGSITALNTYFSTDGKIIYLGAQDNVESRTLTVAITDGTFSASTTAAIRFNDLPVPGPVPSLLGEDVVTNGAAPSADGTTEIGKFDLLRRGGFLADNGDIVFPGFLEIGSGAPAVTAETRSGLWKTDGGDLFLLARTGTTVPDVPGALFATLPEVPGISDEGEVSFLATLVIGSGGVTAANDTGLWSDLGGTGLALLMREDDDVPGLSGVKVGAFASGVYATATTGADSGETAFSVTCKGASTKTAILRASIEDDTTTVSVIAQEGEPAPGTGVNFANVAGSYSDPGRMDTLGNFVFSALTSPGSKEGIWYQPVTGGAPTKVVFAGDAALGTTGTTFTKIYRPSMGSDGFISFRAAVSATGDNATNTRNDGIWAGPADNPAAINCILRRGDGTGVVSNLPGVSRVGNVWGGWLSNDNLGAWKAWLDVDGNATSAAPTDKHAIYSNLSGTMRLAVTVGDTATGTGAATFSGFDLPVVGGDNQYAFIGTLTGGDVVGTTNNEGLWISDADGGDLNLVLRKGDIIETTEGPKVIQKIDLPGSNQTDRRWEQPAMDFRGRMVIFITFGDGSTSQILTPGAAPSGPPPDRG